MVEFRPDDEAGSAETGADIAPVIPLFGARPQAARAWRSTWSDEPDADGGRSSDDDSAPDARALAEKALLRKLRTRQLSESEARTALREHPLEPHLVDELIDAFRGLGYLDDARLAEQLVYTGTARKGQGRQALGRAMAQRGVSRDAADAALAALPDDDAERALEFARGRARSMRSLDRETALRRLTGQLARRGFGGSVALTAARTALDEGTGVRFD